MHSDFINWRELGRVTVMIDAANLENSVKSLGWWVDYRKLMRYFSGNAELTGIRHYCPSFNDQRQNNFFTIRYHVSRELVENSDRYIDLKKMRGEIERGK